MDRILTNFHLGFTIFKDGTVRIFDKRTNRDQKTEIYHFLNLQSVIKDYHYEELKEYANYSNPAVLAAFIASVGDVVFLNVSSTEVGKVGILYLPIKETDEQMPLLDDIRDYMRGFKLEINRYQLVTEKSGNMVFKSIEKFANYDDYFNCLSDKMKKEDNEDGKLIR
jgi:hypothetical protein